MTVPVVWLDARRLCFDQSMVDAMLSGRLWRSRHDFEHHVGEVPGGVDGAVFVVPARYHSAVEVNALIAPLAWALVILTSDEESTFDWRALSHPNMRRWVMTPRPGQHDPAALRFLGEGWSPDTPAIVAGCGGAASLRELDWFFAGQVTHRRRQECARALRRMKHGQLVETPGFLQGLERSSYLWRMASAKLAPCPSGPATPDSFRAYEALEAGCLPLVDAVTPEGWTGYWPLLLGDEPPFPVINDWSTLPALVPELLASWPANANRAFAWWQGYKRRHVVNLEADLAALGAELPSSKDLGSGIVADRVTVLMPTSPIPSHPSTAIIEQTVASIRAYEELADAEVVVMIDGVRAEQEGRRADYDEYVRRLLWLCAHRWRNVVPMLADEHLHQANLTRSALAGFVRTPLILFVEHDTPLCEPIPWAGACDAVESGRLNLLRFHHEAHVLDAHRHLMLDDCPHDEGGVPALRTMQWSQRPHLASADWYRSLIRDYFGTASRTMIEDTMHGVVDHAWRTRGYAAWSDWRLAIYAPPGDMKRSLHLDGRGDDPMYPMTYAYDGDPPAGAPWPTALRVEEGAA